MAFFEGISGETARSDTQAARKFLEGFKWIIEDGDYPTTLVFNVDKTGLFWKHTTTYTFLSGEKKHASRFKAAKDHLTLLFGSWVGEC